MKSEKSTQIDPGALCLYLYHGRTDMSEDLEDWGTEGPVLGPLDWAVITYMGSIRVGVNGEDVWLEVREDFVYYDGVYYGYFSIEGYGPMRQYQKDRMIQIDESLTTPPPTETPAVIIVETGVETSEEMWHRVGKCPPWCRLCLAMIKEDLEQQHETRKS